MTTRTQRTSGVRAPLSVADAEMISRTRRLGWDAGVQDEPQDLRSATMREGLAAKAFEHDCSHCQGAIRRAHLVGVIGGLVLAFVALVIGMAVHAAIDTNWPVACDGTSALGSCAARIIGAMT